MKNEILIICQSVLPGWKGLTVDDFVFDDPKGFSSFTMGVRAKIPVQPQAVLYRQLEGKENAILNFETEKEVFLTLGANKIAAHCHYYDEHCRIEAFYTGRTLFSEELFESENLRKIANELYRFHQLAPVKLPKESLFELVHSQWGELAKKVIEDHIDHFPSNEQALCEELRPIYSTTTFEKVKKCMPDGPLTFCHNDTYHGNIMKLDNGEIKLLDFEFSCLNNKAYDFSNLFAETVMRHQDEDYPYFKIAEPEFGDTELSLLINFYLDNIDFKTSEARDSEFNKLLADTKKMLVLSDYKYAMAALTLAIEPIQKIRFIPYAHQRYHKFLNAVDLMT